VNYPFKAHSLVNAIVNEQKAMNSSWLSLNKVIKTLFSHTEPVYFHIVIK